jgi:hypothetical protein
MGQANQHRQSHPRQDTHHHDDLLTSLLHRSSMTWVKKVLGLLPVLSGGHREIGFCLASPEVSFAHLRAEAPHCQEVASGGTRVKNPSFLPVRRCSSAGTVCLFLPAIMLFSADAAGCFLLAPWGPGV